MRLFLAIDLPKETKRSIAQQLESFKKEYPYFRWVDEARYHITLHFFGDRDDTKEISKKIRDAVFDIEEFTMYSNGADLFIKNSIILYLNFQRNREIEKLVTQVRDIFTVSTEGRYIPHMTIARYRIPSKQQYLLIKKKVSRLNIDVEFKITQITLLNSVIESEKPLYETIDKIDLEKTNG